MKSSSIKLFAWGLSIFVAILAIVAWGQGFEWDVDSLNAYLLFPLFGLLAFSLMWTHYVVGAVRRSTNVDKSALKDYFAITGWSALVFILLHPSLLILQLWRDNGSLPPESYVDYVGPAMKWAVMLGTFSFTIFLAFETKRWFSKKGWWPIIEYGNVVAMVAIIAHSLALGTNLQSGWFRWVWIGYALSLLVSVSYIYYQEAKDAKQDGGFTKKVIGISLVAAIVVGVGIFAYLQ